MAALSSDALVSSIQSEIKRVTDNLKDVDDNLRRLTGRDFNETRDPLNFREPNLRDLPNSNFREPKPNLRESRPRGERRIRLTSGGRDDEPPPKRRPPGGVFARLGEPVSDNLRGRRVHEVKEEEGEIARHPKPSLASSVARPVIDGKSRTEAAAELTKDKASRERNRRMFGALLGTLQRFRTEEAKQKGKDEQRAKIEKKLEEKGRAEREKLQREKMQLINQRKEQQAKIKRLQFKMERVKEHEVWEEHQRKLVKFIMTRSKPQIFWVPKLLTSDTSRLISQTKDKIEKDLEEARLRLKEDLDEVLGGRRVLPLRRDEEEEKEGDGEGNEIGFSNCSDLLGYPAEEGELVFEEDVLLSAGKKREDESARRVVVQVDRSGVDRRPQRRVELVTVLASDRSKRVKREGEGNESEKENVLRSKIDARNEGENVENGRMKAREKEREKDKGKEKEREREREKERERDKKEKRKEKEEKDRKGRDKRGHSDNSKALPSSHNESLSKSKKKHKKGRTKEAVIPEPEPEPDPDAESELEEEEEEEEPWAEDLSHISLPIEPEPLAEAESDIPAVEVPNLREIVVQHLPADGTLGTGDDDGGLLQVETVSLPIDPVVIKKDPEGAFPIKKGLPILIIKKEKDPSPPRGHKAVENGVPSPVASPANKEDSDSESSDSSSESEEESSSEEEEEESSSSEEDSSGSSTSSDSAEEKKRSDSSSDEERRKKSDKGKPAPSASRKRKDSSDSSDSESSDSDDKPSPSKKKTSKGSHRAPSPKPSRRGQDRPGEKRRSGRRSRSRDRRRERSRSRDRRRGRK